MKFNKLQRILSGTALDDNLIERVKGELKKEDQDTYREWEKDNFDINYQFTTDTEAEKVTLLCIAILQGNEKMVDLLIAKGADPNKENIDGLTPLSLAVSRGNEKMANLLVKHIARLEAIELYVSEKNLQEKEELLNNSVEKRDNFSQYFLSCREEAKKIEKENKPLYNFLRENNTANLVDIWEKSKDVRSKLSDLESLKEQYPEYADILINKTNKVRKEIFLYNHKSLINVLSEHYKCDLQAMTFFGMHTFFSIHKCDKIFKENPIRLGSIIGRFVEEKYLINCEERGLKLVMRALKCSIENGLLSKNLNNPRVEQLRAVGCDLSA